MNEFSNRIIQIAEFYGVTRAADFAKKTGFSHQTASNYLKGDRIPTGDSLKIIQQSFDKISAKWLLTGEGEMLQLEETKIQENPRSVEIQKLQKIIQKQQETIDKLVDTIQKLTSNVKER
ncbi:MAG: hypothetical protein FD166_2979 [Bacteroidetes bacterium]|nr:MAG: hypothetical protein FD166_2979 [Bacteroidota bacterium]